MSTIPVYDYMELLKPVLEQIRTANGFLTDLGANVTLEDTQQLDDEGGRIVLLQDTLAAPSAQAMRGVGHRSVIAIVAQHPRTQADAQRRLHLAQTDVMRCLGDRNRLTAALKTAGVNAQFPQFEDSTFATSVPGVAWVGVAVRYSVHVPFPR